MDHQVEGVDLISSLPDSILHHILSFLDSPQDLVFTSVLSKQWLENWKSFPIFEFSQDKIADILYQRAAANPSGHPGNTWARAGEEVMRYASGRLASFREQRESIGSFALEIWPTEAQIPQLDDWVQMLVEKNASEIYLEIMPHYGRKIYTLPNRILSSASLTCLTVDSCSLPANFMSHDVPINSLEKLALRFIELSEEALRHLAVVFPSMKELFLNKCRGHTRIIFPFLKKLEKVEVHSDMAEVIQLDAPKLQHLSFNSLPSNVLFNISSCISKIKRLHVSCKHSQITAFCQLVSSCTVLEELSFHVSVLGDRFILASLSLKKLTLGRCLDTQEIMIDAPSLEYFRYDGEPTSTIFVFTSQTVKCEAHVSLPCDPEKAVAPWLIRLNEFLHRTVQFKALHMTFGENDVDVDALYQSKITPFELHEMVISYEPVDLNYIELFPAVFCCCSPLSLTLEPVHELYTWGSREEIFGVGKNSAKYIYEQLQREEDGDWERQVVILQNHQRFASLEEFIVELPALRYDQEVCFKTRRVERVKKKRRFE